MIVALSMVGILCIAGGVVYAVVKDRKKAKGKRMRENSEAPPSSAE